MIRKRLLSALALLVGGVLLFTACGSETTTNDATDNNAETTTTEATETNETDTTTASDEPVEIVIWTNSRHDMPFMEAQIARFNEENDDINVVVEIYSDNFVQTLMIASSTGTLPDIFNDNPGSRANLLASDDLLMIGNYVSAEFRERFPDDLFVDGIHMSGGEIFTFPAWSNAARLIYNRDILERVGLDGPPTTLDELVEYANLVTEQLGDEGIFGFSLPMNNPASALGRGFNNLPQILGYPVDNTGYNFVTGEYDFAPFRAGVEALAEIWAAGSAFPGSEALDIDPLRTQFADGRIAFYFSWNFAEFGVFTTQFPTEINWDYALLPTQDGNFTSQMDFGGGWWAASANTEHPHETARVYEFLYSVELLSARYEQGFGVSVLPDVIAAAETPINIVEHPFMAFQPTDVVWPQSPTGLAVEGNDFQTEFVNFILLGGTGDLDALIADLNARYNAALDHAIENGVTERIIFPNFDPANPAASTN